ncbi:MAG: peptidoglycan editing factor PgeF [Bryobacteraceae bacterium]
MNCSFRLAPDGIYRCDAFQEFVWQRHGFGTRDANPRAAITLKQVHSNRVVNANGVKDGEREGDALITDCIGRSIGVRTADCVPILALDCRNRAIAAVHAGWRGTAEEIAKRTVEWMRAEFQSDPRDLYIAIGPCIRVCCYEVGEEVASRFEAQSPASETAKRNIDLPGTNRRQMQQAGVNPERIFDCGLCTACEGAQFFSYRREPANPGRMVAAIERLA